MMSAVRPVTEFEEVGSMLFYDAVWEKRDCKKA
jgi:hypothetical protein